MKRTECHRRTERVPQVTEDPTYIRDVHNTKEYDCEIHNKRIKDRWKREVSRVRTEL